MMYGSPKRPAPGAGKTTTHSKPFAMGSGSVRMPAAQAPARIPVPKDHTCKVCPGSARKR